jgi:cyclopropane-fatty-acyl-phospholipid synthase
MSASQPTETVPRGAASPITVGDPELAVLERTASTARGSQTTPALRPALLDRLARRLVLRLLSRMRRGELVLVEEPRRLRFGAPGDERSPSAELHVRSPRFYRDFLRGSLGLGEAYAGGLWDCADLVSLTRIGALNMGSLDTLRRVFSPVLAPLQRAAGWLARNTPARARKRIAAHYDLGNELFSQFLDRTMMYSCAVFDPPTATLEQASLAKLERICTKLKLSPADHVLEIGTGWGGFAEYAAARYGCRVTTTTISAEQHAYATERIRNAKLRDRVTVLFEDYRDPALDRLGPYDKLVSIEMIEAVGWQYFPTFFRRCSELVAEHGAMLLQAIVIEDRAYEVEKASKSFANTHIFPGGCLPSLQVIARNVARVTDFREAHLEDITPHYATTLQRWRERFLAAAEQVSELGYDERFRRMWELYLSYCEGGFRERRIQDVQLLLAKPGFS